MSHQFQSERIIAEQQGKAQQYLQERQEAAAKDRERQALATGWAGVADFLEPEGSVRSLGGGPGASLAAAVEQLALLRRRLSARGLLGWLDETPCGVEGEDLQAWQIAHEILHLAAADPAEARRLLSQVQGLPFAPTVRNWLCHGFRIVVEGGWQTGPLCVEMTRPLHPQREASQPKNDQTPSEVPQDQGSAGQREGGEEPRKRGRKSRCDWRKDQEVAEGWERAKGAGIPKKQCACGQKLSLKQLNRILNRHAKRMQRGNKNLSSR